MQAITPEPPVYFTGLDLGQTKDPSAVAVLERTIVSRDESSRKPVFRYACRHLERWPLGTSYPAVVDRMAEMFADPPLRDTVLVVDQTGVGRAVVDMIRRANVTPKPKLRPITITGGNVVTFGGDGARHVPKKDLVGCLQVLFQSRRIHVAPTLPEAATLVKEMENFKMKITAAANEIFEAWRDGDNDDLVLAVAIAAWVGERDTGYSGMAGYTRVADGVAQGCPAAFGYAGQGLTSARGQKSPPTASMLRRYNPAYWGRGRG